MLLILTRILLLALSAFFVASCVTTPEPSNHYASLTLYRNDRLRPAVTEYYSRLTQDRTVALAILEACDRLDLDPSLGFAMAWNESRFNPRAVGRNTSTVDRGLFQLNSATFASLDHRTVFDPKANALHGLSFYKKVFDKLGTEEKALGYYNSGIGMISKKAYPRSTQAYIKRVLADRAKMDRDAIAWIYFSHDAPLALR